MKFNKVTRKEFVESTALYNDPKGDKFARTFIRKADMLRCWGDFTIGAFDDNGNLMGAVAVSVTKREPHVLNLQLLHTFAKYRKQGVGRHLMACAILYGKCVAQYFRVSAEPDAIAFYERIGFFFWGYQKSGCALSMFRFAPDPPGDKCAYDPHDPVISKALSSKQRGGVHQMMPTEFVTLPYEPYNRLQDLPKCLSIIA